MAEKQYDLIVIGAGSGMLLIQYAAVNLGWETALVEKGPLGGTCLNRGCIPSKRLIHSADIAETVRHSSRFGVRGEITGIDFDGIVRKTKEHVDRQAARMAESIKNQEIFEYYQGEAVFCSPHTLLIGDEEISARRFVIAAGCRPRIPDINGLSEVDFWTSNEALRPPAQPESLIIIGGGYIAVELAHFYGALGTRVTLIQRSSHLLSREDEEVAAAFTEIFSTKYRVLTGASVNRVSRTDQGLKKVTVTDGSGRVSELEAECLLVATGLKPNTDILALENTYMERDEQGYVKTDEYLATTQPGTWALGDIIGRAPFKHAANREANTVAHNLIAQKKVAMDYSIMPHAVFSSPQVASVGLTEQEARSRGLDYEVRKFAYTDTAMGEAVGADQGFVKYIVFPEKGRIAGCHIIGPQASILIHEVIVAMMTGDQSIDAILGAVHIHPSLSEVVQWGL
ncbi:MAG: dihydrolipoyl dehydrogenase family protein [Desulfurivibrionaceae bacterium]